MLAKRADSLRRSPGSYSLLKFANDGKWLLHYWLYDFGGLDRTLLILVPFAYFTPLRK
jgi:hypothetical protein